MIFGKCAQVDEDALISNGLSDKEIVQSVITSSTKVNVEELSDDGNLSTNESIVELSISQWSD